ncbi:MAG: hypothetical protein ABSD58_01340 [Verrucomicrobiia bacterium]|jgi:hypothetical protein
MNRKDKAKLVTCGFWSGISFAILVFRFNQKDIHRESLYNWTGCFLLCLAVCLWAIFKADKKGAQEET